MVRRQPAANSRKITPRKSPQTPVVDAELLPEEAEKTAKPDDLELKDEWAIAPLDAEVSEVAEPELVSSPPAEPELEMAATSDLEANLMALKEALEQSNQKEQLLQKSVEDLRSQLDEQKTLVQKLQTSLEKANKIQSELDKTQKEALKLAESNQALIDENKALKQEQQTLKEKLSTQAKSSQLTVQPSPAQPTIESKRDSLRKHQAATLARPVFSNESMQNSFSDQDIGWFD
ncbi:MAG: hypothetical protein LH660_13605 [Phormidesmis sp. CAN_BIN36]|nr:hypothetical protein [Phormidesmis sp. CAN_BIN36]